MSITHKIPAFAHDLGVSRFKEMENSHLESALTTTYFEKASKGRLKEWP